MAGCHGAEETSDTLSRIDAGPEKTVTSHPAEPALPGETACTVTMHTGIPTGTSTHMALCTHIDYPTNPPSWGPHWPQWAAFKTYTTPVPRELYVHDLEHGAIVLAYRCKSDCPDVVAFLQAAMDAVPADPKCDGSEARARLVLTPDPELEHPVAAAAWGATYTATCLDKASLAAFIAAHYGRAPEDFCSQGTDAEGVSNACSADGGVEAGRDIDAGFDANAGMDAGVEAGP